MKKQKWMFNIKLSVMLFISVFVFVFVLIIQPKIENNTFLYEYGLAIHLGAFLFWLVIGVLVPLIFTKAAKTFLAEKEKGGIGKWLLGKFFIISDID